VNVPLLVLVGGGLIAFLAVRFLAMRRVAAGGGIWAWVAFSPPLLLGVWILWTAARVMADDPVLGLVLMVGAVLYVVSIVWMLDRVARGVTKAGSGDEIESAVTGPVTDHMVLMIGVTLIGGLVLLVVLIAYGVLRAVG